MIVGKDELARKVQSVLGKKVHSTPWRAII